MPKFAPVDWKTLERIFLAAVSNLTGRKAAIVPISSKGRQAGRHSHLSRSPGFYHPQQLENCRNFAR
jgi:hypothetical protein